MIDIFYADHGSNDWIVVKDGDKTLFEGYRIGVYDLANILARYGKVNVSEIDVKEEND